MEGAVKALGNEPFAFGLTLNELDSGGVGLEGAVKALANELFGFEWVCTGGVGFAGATKEFPTGGVALVCTGDAEYPGAANEFGAGGGIELSIPGIGEVGVPLALKVFGNGVAGLEWGMNGFDGCVAGEGLTLVG